MELALLDRPTPLDLVEGGRVTLRGVVTTSIDGSSFDATLQWSGLAVGAPREPGLFDLAAGGLRVAEQHPERHEYVLAATGAQPPACAGVGARACLVPRLGVLAHERLQTESELAQTLSGGIAIEDPSPPGLGSMVLEVGLRAAAFVAGMLVVAALGALLLALHRRSRAAFARVRSAARVALAATRSDPSFAELRTQIGDLATRARQMDADRRDHARALRRIDRVEIQRRIDAHARSGSTEGVDVLTWLRRERDEGDRLEREIHACEVGLERIESALRVVALRARDRRGAKGPTRTDPVDTVALELELRAAAMAEADRAVG